MREEVSSSLSSIRKDNERFEESSVFLYSSMEEEPNKDGDEESFVAPNGGKPVGSHQSAAGVGEGGSCSEYKGVGRDDTIWFKENVIKEDLKGPYALNVVLSSVSNVQYSLHAFNDPLIPNECDVENGRK